MIEPTYSIAQDSENTQAEILRYIEYCRKQPDDEIIKECITFCDLNIEKFDTLKNEVAKTGGQKQCCYFTINLIQSLKDDLTSILEKEGGQLGKNIKWVESQSALDKSIRTGFIKNLRHVEPVAFFEDAKLLFETEIHKTLIDKKYNLKVYTILEATFAREKGEETVKELKHFNTKSFPIFLTSNVQQLFEENVSDVILTDMAEFQERESGWTLKRIELLNVIISKYNPMRCGSYIPLPTSIANKKACINVKNYDNQCFKWAVISALTHLRGYKIDNSDRVNKYKKYEQEFNLNFEGLEFPIQPDDISKFEKQNNLSINLYMLQYEKRTFQVLPMYVTSNKQEIHIHLLIIQNNYEPPEQEKNKSDVIVTKKRRMDILSEEPKTHYVWIKNLSRLIKSQVSSRQHALHICDRCLTFFYSREKLKQHEIDCIKMNECAIKLPTLAPDQKDDSYKILKFQNFKKKLPVPFVCYADFESVLEKIEGDKRKLHEHKPCAVGYYLMCNYDESLSYYRNHVGMDSAVWFVQELKAIAEKVEEIYKNPKPMNKLTMEEEEDFLNATHCHICESPFKEGDQRVRDHCHLTGKYLFIYLMSDFFNIFLILGKYRAAAHSNCNLVYQDSRTIPVVFHNLSGYDGHYVIKALANSYPGKIKLIPLNKEKYISFTKYIDGLEVSLRFIDSLRFLNASLDKLIRNLDDLPFLNRVFADLTPHQRDLLSNKGIFFYEYLDDMKKLYETDFPTIDKFYSKLNDSNINEKEYQHALKVYQDLDCKNLMDYLLHYLNSDVILMVDVIEKFRQESIEIYGLDPLNYFTLPGYSFDAMFKYTKVELELLTDIDMLMFIERGVRGGVSQCSNRHSKANNQYMPDFDDTQESKYIMYFDVNNLYGNAMEKPLPTGGFRWLSDEELKSIDINLLVEESVKGWILEVDLEYPQEIHDEHKDLPFCPEHSAPPGSKQKKITHHIA